MTKAVVYAEAAIPSYWRVVIEGPDTPRLLVMSLHAGAYTTTTEVGPDHSAQLTEPFALTISPAMLLLPRGTAR